MTHTLVGASLAQTGLKDRTALGTATLLVGANLPDVDVLAYFWGNETAVWFRRGLTHGLLALVVLPLVLTGVVLLWDRAVRRPAAGEQRPVVPRQVLMLAALAVATHPLLDFLNVYGMRWLAPFSWRWFYGDTLFIVDPWVWGLLAAGIWLARRGTVWPKLGMTAAVVYTLGMWGSGQAARNYVSDELKKAGVTVQRAVAAPMAVTPFVRWVVVETAGGYSAGVFHWLPRPRVDLQPLPFDRGPEQPMAEAAVEATQARRFLAWARFPYFLVSREGEGYAVRIGDARYTLDPESSWASTTIHVDSSVP
ncbi:MAG: metal-dependent hydrolase [Gemmatimonadetes bacterium]|uniref:Metal-dependent hydrolase n=1 Tax=Candidatus Kutchimonas denitrificans TaxID=3056748 RepID=A0AAE4ZC53_9BACT|nr:metal-dependent hydrolase [Gemmatimonadota bacterium]NIR76386.1 metal-dependent hydrolase [Candidatus Kutchimonas denitrificans]NIS03196.1 metal-dependent hydrolase [Gemmatimonadota bacterium]NIT66369.1 metal-dependent hydrolase [Gemmatimonadota bacterium]NIV22926.1 hypothetical protein [Gemmatimonadota bacterium]